MVWVYTTLAVICVITLFGCQIFLNKFFNCDDSEDESQASSKRNKRS